jgi:hypothetical protein
MQGLESQMDRHASSIEYFFFGMGIAMITAMLFFGAW